MEIDFEGVKALLPQRFPFLMIDRVSVLEKGERVVAVKNVTGNEIFFLGHFPERAVMPGALVLEALAQAAIVLFRKSFEEPDGGDGGGDRLFFLRSAKIRFLEPVVPGDRLELEVTLTKAVSAGAMVEAAARVDGGLVAKGELSFAVKPAPSPPSGAEPPQ